MEVNISTTIKLHKTFLHVIAWPIPSFKLQCLETKRDTDYFTEEGKLQTWKCIPRSNKDNQFYFEN